MCLNQGKIKANIVDTQSVEVVSTVSTNRVLLYNYSKLCVSLVYKCCKNVTHCCKNVTKVRHLRHPVDTLSTLISTPIFCCIPTFIGHIYPLSTLFYFFYFLAQYKNKLSYRCRRFKRSYA